MEMEGGKRVPDDEAQQEVELDENCHLKMMMMMKLIVDEKKEEWDILDQDEKDLSRAARLSVSTPGSLQECPLLPSLSTQCPNLVSEIPSKQQSRLDLAAVVLFCGFGGEEQKRVRSVGPRDWRPS